MQIELLLCLFLGLSLGQDLITSKRAKELRDTVSWKVADPKNNPLRNYTVSEFRDTMKGARPITREKAKDVQTVLPELKPTEIKAILDSHYHNLALNNNTTAIVENHTEYNNTHNNSRVLQDDDYYDEQEWYDYTWNKYGDNEESSDEDVSYGSYSEGEVDTSGLPVFFDGRKRWGGCIHSGGNQFKCNGCWAFGIINHLSDRFCIWGRDVILSVQDMLECTSGNNCCTGGTATNGYNFMIERGAVSENCKDFSGDCSTCRSSSCTRYKCRRNSIFWANTIEEAKREIYNNGPIEAVFDVFEDFTYYAGGVYYQTSKKMLGVHTVEVLGWGVENGVNYWLCKNSWGDDWGSASFFKIKMGECGINEAMTTCRPLV